MAESKTKPKWWWWKYIILPLVGTGGIGAIIVAVLSHGGGSNNSGIQVNNSGAVGGSTINTIGNSNTINTTTTYVNNGPVTINQTLSREDLLQLVNAAAKFGSVDTNIIETNYPAFGIFIAASLHKIAENRQKFVYDHGTLERNRFSVYLSDDNALLLRVIDSAGDTYSLRVPRSEFQFDQFAYFHFEVANKGDSSFLKTSIDGTSVKILELNHLIDISALRNSGPDVFASDLEQRKFASLTLGFWATWKSTLTREQEINLVKATTALMQK